MKKYGKLNLYKGYWLELNGLDAVLGKYFERREVLTLKELTEKKFGGGDDDLEGKKWNRRASRTPSTPVLGGDGRVTDKPGYVQLKGPRSIQEMIDAYKNDFQQGGYAAIYRFKPPGCEVECTAEYQDEEEECTTCETCAEGYEEVACDEGCTCFPIEDMPCGSPGLRLRRLVRLPLHRPRTIRGLGRNSGHRGVGEAEEKHMKPVHSSVLRRCWAL